MRWPTSRERAAPAQGPASAQDDYLALALDALMPADAPAQQATSDDPSSDDALMPFPVLDDGSEADADSSLAGTQQPVDAMPSPLGAGAADVSASASPATSQQPGPNVAAAQAPSPASSQVVDTGTGTGQTYNVHNGTDRQQYFLYSDANGHKAVMDLKSGETGTFTGGDNQPGIRIQSCGPNGETRSPANQALFEAGSQTTMNKSVNNPDVSDVDGNLSYDGRGTDIEIVSNTGQKVGNLTGDAYRNWNDDTKTDRSNPMTMAQTTANSFDITFSDAAQTLDTPGNR